MNVLDAILLLCFVPAVIQGLRKGFISQVISIISLIIGVWLSFRFSSSFSTWLAGYIDGNERILNIISFILILILTSLVLSAIGKMMEKVIRILMLEWLNKLFGVIFSLLKTTLILGLLVMTFSSVNSSFRIVDDSKLSESAVYSSLQNIADVIFPYMKEMLFENKSQINEKNNTDRNINRTVFYRIDGREYGKRVQREFRA